MNYSQKNWSYPGSRWWKFDFHTHTPASHDTGCWQQWKGTDNELTPEKWLLKYMEAGIECVAVTDHNTGEWIDKLKAAYKKMRRQAENRTQPSHFREIILFPGVEISVNGGFHLLAIFDPTGSTQTINDLLASVRYRGTNGDSDGVTEASATDVMREVLGAGGIPIPAHSDQKKGLLRVNPGTHECALDSGMIRQVMANEELLAIEWLDTTLPVPTHVEKKVKLLARVWGSDCHNFEEIRAPGSRYTWIKMANPTLEGLRLALLDGNGVSVRRSDEETFEPFQTPTHFISHIEVNSARYMGNGKPEQLNFSPYYNAIIGGRGTGKSTIVHSLRLVYRRDEELRRLGGNAEPKRQFDSFSKPVDGREGDGALRNNTKIRIDISSDGTMHRLIWCQDGKGGVVEEQDNFGKWKNSPSQALTTERFPVRLFSQGQIAAMAGDSSQALLDVIDEAADIGRLHRIFEEEKRTYFSQRAQLREMDGRLESRPEIKRKLDELNRKLEAISQSAHSEILKAHQQAVGQCREVNTSLQQLRRIPDHIESLVQDVFLDDWTEGVFDPKKDQNMISWKNQVDQILGETREAIIKIVRNLMDKVNIIDTDDRLKEWRQSVSRKQLDYKKLKSDLAKQGVTDPDKFGEFLQDWQQFGDQLKQLDQLQQDRDHISEQNESQWKRVLCARESIAETRQQFVQSTLANNRFVRIEVVRFGFEVRNIERSLRDLLDCRDDRFENDILWVVDEEPMSGLAFELAQSKSEDREEVLKMMKQYLISADQEKFGGHFKNFLKRKLERPEFEDHIKCWFPEDDLRIQYSRSGDGDNWVAITQGSQGQRSAALLAFLLAFGDEPLVLDQPEDDLDNHLIYDLIVRQIRENKLRRQLIIITHNPNIVVNGDAEMVHALDFRRGQCRVFECGALQDKSVREEVCRVMEGGREAFSRRWARLGREV